MNFPRIKVVGLTLGDYRCPICVVTMTCYFSRKRVAIAFMSAVSWIVMHFKKGTQGVTVHFWRSTFVFKTFL